MYFFKILKLSYHSICLEKSSNSSLSKRFLHISVKIDRLYLYFFSVKKETLSLTWTLSLLFLTY